MNTFDMSALHDFLTQTPEQGLRKMLIDNKTFTDVHFNMLIKMVRGCNREQFSVHCEKNDFPKIKFSANEIKLKETFWANSIKVCDSRGLLSPASPQKIAA
ncbi:MAG: hypothetical protein ACK5P5_07295 [Pseudobdellovibrionaceae bacterium]|jgi:hypothetical protein